MTKGTPAADTLKEVIAAIPSDTEITVAGVAPEVADKLMDIIQNGGTQAELMELLKEFPVQTIDGVDCYVVTLSYTDAAGKPVTENYAFSTVDGSLVKLF